MEDQMVWHHKVPSDEQLVIALKELDTAKLELGDV